MQRQPRRDTGGLDNNGADAYHAPPLALRR